MTVLYISPYHLNYFANMDDPTQCQHCGTGQEVFCKQVACDSCGKWSHRKSVYLQDVKEVDLEKVDWMCKL